LRRFAPAPATDLIWNRETDMTEFDPIRSLEEAPLTLIQTRWWAVLEELKRRKATTTFALASCARPARVEEGALVLQIGIPTLLTLFQRGHHRSALAAAIETVVGRRYQIALEPPPPAGDRVPCAKCGSAKVALCGVEKDGNAEGAWVSGKIVRLYFRCENGHAWKQEFGVHDGATFTRTVIGPALE
jgi:hypothetical protein